MTAVQFRTAAPVLCMVCAAWAQAPVPADVPPPTPAPFLQVQMHVWISETTEQGLRDLGANLTYTRIVDGVETQGDSLQQVSTNLFNPRNPLFNVTLPAPDRTQFSAPLRPDQSTLLPDLQTQSGAGLTFSLIEQDHGSIDGAFRSIEQKSELDLISKPELVVINGAQATIKAGSKVPFQGIDHDLSGRTQLLVAFKDIGVNMVVVPTIRPDKLIKLDLQALDVTDVIRIDNIRGIDLPVISTRSQTGEVLVPDGQALVIGGLSTRVATKSERRVPLLGRIPILGIPFRARRSETDSTHLIVFVEPTVVDLRKMNAGTESALKFWQEGGWKHEGRIEEEVAIMENKR